MTRFEWNGLRIGDIVSVHAPLATVDPSVVGTVRHVTEHAGGRNDVGIRLHGAALDVWPSWLAVHRAEHPALGTCWRCDAVAARIA